MTTPDKQKFTIQASVNLKAMGELRVLFDALPWFEQASDDEIYQFLTNDEYDCGCIAEYVANNGLNADVKALLEADTVLQRIRLYNEKALGGYSVHVAVNWDFDEWLADNRPSLEKRLGEGEPADLEGFDAEYPCDMENVPPDTIPESPTTEVVEICDTPVGHTQPESPSLVILLVHSLRQMVRTRKPGVAECEALSRVLKSLFPDFYFVDVFHVRKGWNSIRIDRRIDRAPYRLRPDIAAHITCDYSDKSATITCLPKDAKPVSHKFDWAVDYTATVAILSFLREHLIS